MNPETCRIISRWLLRLDRLTRRPADDPLDDQALSDMAEMLAENLPAEAFTLRSLDAVASRADWFPPYATILATVGAWWRDNRPKPPALPGPGGASDRLDGMGRAWVAFWRKRKAEADMNPGKLASLLGMIRSLDPGAFQALIETDNTAANVAVVNRMTAVGTALADEVKADWADPEAVRCAVASVLAPMPDGSQPGNVALLLRVLHGLVSMHAPQNLGLIPGYEPSERMAAE